MNASKRACTAILATVGVVSVLAGHPVADGTSSASRAHTGGFLARGTLLTERPLTNAAALSSAGSNRLVTYLSEDASGEPIVVSGTVSVPKTPPPPGGWPVISWAHGTTGTADTCAPSQDTVDAPAHDYLGLVDESLDTWVARGYAVAQTDYEGLGTPGEHPYLNGPSETNTVLDIVRAAQRMDSGVGRDWVSMGHSQGGQAALFNTTDTGTHDVRLLGSVAIAPGGVNVSQVAEYIKSDQPGAETAIAFLPPLLLGAAAAEPSVRPDELLTRTAQPLLTAGRTACLAMIRKVAATIDPSDVFQPKADLGPLTRYLQRQDPSRLRPQVPVMIAQGTEDAEVARPQTDGLVDALCSRTPALNYRVYPGADHRGSIDASLSDIEQYVDSLLAHRRPATTC